MCGRRHRIPLCLALYWIVIGSGVIARGHPNRGAYSPPYLTAPHRDGIKLDAGFADWKGIPFTTVTPQTGVFDTEVPSTQSPDDLSFRFAVCHDDDALYVAVEVTDDAVQADSCKPDDIHAPAWDDDAIEVFIDGDHNHAPDARIKDGSELKFGGEFSLIINGAATSQFSGYPRTFGQREFWQGATNWAAIQNGEKVLRYEYRINWNVMGGKVAPGQTIGFSLAVQDDDDGGRRDHSFYWKGNAARPFLDERGWGDVYLQPRAIGEAQ